MIYRYMQLIPERPKTPNLDRWFGATSGSGRVQGAERRGPADAAAASGDHSGSLRPADSLIGGLGPPEATGNGPHHRAIKAQGRAAAHRSLAEGGCEAAAR